MTVATTTPVGTTGVPFVPVPTAKTAGAPRSTGSKSLDKNAFLQLLVTQLKNQDPTSPQDTSQMAAQLAQFTSLEQMTNISTAITAQTAAITAQSQTQQTAMASSLIGRAVVATGNTLVVGSDGSATLTIDNGSASGAGTLTLVDATGAVVKTQSLGTVASGRQVLPVSGLPAGMYTYGVTTGTSAGTTASATTYTAGIVTGLNFNTPGVASLQVNGTDVPLSSVIEVDR
jgi:flagellar basal-body rod modification protein FlgD